MPQVTLPPWAMGWNEDRIRLALEYCQQTWHSWVLYLELPHWKDYGALWSDAMQDVRRACGSVGTLTYVTWKPLCLLCAWLLRHVLRFLQFLSKHLFHQVYVSCGKGWVQFQWAVQAFLKWQYGLGRTAILLELGVALFLVGCYLLRRYIQRQQYVSRLAKWHRQKKRHVKERYNRVVRRIAKTSLWLAMCLPHALFLASSVGIKLLVPRLVTYLANETYATALLSLWYPLVWTIGLLHHHRQGDTKSREPTVKNATKSGTTLRAIPNTPPKTPERQQSSSATVFPRTTPRSVAMQRWIRAATTPRKSSEQNSVDLYEDTDYWLKYWIVYTLFLAVRRVLYSLPFVARIVIKSTLLRMTLNELQLVFFLWIFVLPSFITTTTTTDKDYDSRPLELLSPRIFPVLTLTYNSITNAIPATMWESLVQKVQSVLELAVLIKLLSPESKDGIIHFMTHSNALLPPAITLLMPGFITGYGVLYVQAVVPSAKSALALKKTSLQDRKEWLQYWVLNAVVSMILSWWASLLWWIPFSTHLVFLLWCHLQFPSTIEKWYNILEEELQAFGLLDKGDKDLQVDNTVTAAVLRRLANSLPSGVGDDENQESSHDPPHKPPSNDDSGSDDVVAVSKQQRDAPESDSDENESDRANMPVRRSTRLRKERTSLE